MDEYIGRDKVKSAVYEISNSDYLFVDAVIDAIDNTLAADVVEVRHGRWEPAPTAYGFVRCGNCKDELSEHWDGLKKWPCCNVCGARMDGE